MNVRFIRKPSLAVAGLNLIFTVLPANAGMITKTNTFNPGDTISSSQMNVNFDQLFTEINAKETRISTLETNSTHWDGGATGLNAAAGRANLGLGTAATLSVGTSANNVVQLDGSGKLPAVDGSQLTHMAANSSGVLGLDLELDETSGTTFADTSGYGATVTAPMGGIAVGSSGHSGKSVNFTGGVIQVAAGKMPVSPQVWVEAWINAAGPLNGTTQTILNKTGIYSLTTTSGALTFNVTTPGSACTVSTAIGVITTSTWIHTAGWYNGLKIVVSVNGALTSASCTGGPASDNTTASLFIGAADGSGTLPYSGKVDEVRVRTVAPFP